MANLPNLRTVRPNVLLLVRERNNKTEKEKHGWPQQPFLAGVPTSVHYIRSGCQGRLVHWPWPHPLLWHGIASSLRTNTTQHTNTGLRLKSAELCRRMFSLYSNLYDLHEHRFIYFLTVTFNLTLIYYELYQTEYMLVLSFLYHQVICASKKDFWKQIQRACLVGLK